MTYLQELEQALTDLPQSEQENIIDYYRNYFADGKLSDTAAREKLGEPAALAKKLRVEFVPDEEQDNSATGKTASLFRRDGWLFWLMVLISAPIWFPLLITAYVLIIILPFMAWVVAIAFILASAFVVIAGAVVCPQNLWAGLFYIGIGLALLGVPIIASSYASWLSLKASDWAKSLTHTLYRLIRKVAKR
ncbi:DUF1700 domain-containing protein [Fructobacillus durionis]|uniref:Uncharacterized membrane protein n=1 Tax=Fructobacillus durionis TaxID=283737 RepID=A0A1I1FB47_9LACO|nr:DUF1700 domain-containing protein [Fructobacillus durionis]SFB94300.1 Uncharacterized membrane protein [Fructobacillus durionis]